MRNILTIGLTGGIASGKSTVAELFAQLGIDIIDADLIARQLTEDPAILTELTEHFGAQVIKDQSLNRSALAEIVFNDEQQRTWLNQLLHPKIRQRMLQQIANSQSPYCICVIPLLAESTQIDFLNRILVVDTPESLQLERLIARDQFTLEQAELRLDAQASRSERLAIADDVIENTGDLAELTNRVQALHRQYLKLSSDHAIKSQDD